MKRTVLSLATGLLILGTAAMAKAPFSGTVKSEYKLTGKSASAVNCKTCHTTGKNLNAYGASLKTAMKGAKQLTPAALKAVAAQDADKDGKANAVELKAGTNPGDPKSK